MLQEYSKDQLRKLYEKLPEELKEVVFSAETADNVWNVCEKYNIDQISKIAKLIDYVLCGVLPPQEFSQALEKELKLEKESAKKAAQEIYRFVFYPVKTALEGLYGGEIAAKKEEITEKTPTVKAKIKTELKKEREEKTSVPPAPPTPQKEDKYREIIK